MRDEVLHRFLDAVMHQERRHQKMPSQYITHPLNEHLGNPSLEYASVHVAGINGKGGCCV